MKKQTISVNVLLFKIFNNKNFIRIIASLRLKFHCLAFVLKIISSKFYALIVSLCKQNWKMIAHSILSLFSILFFILLSILYCTRTHLNKSQSPLLSLIIKNSSLCYFLHHSPQLLQTFPFSDYSTTHLHTHKIYIVYMYTQTHTHIYICMQKIINVSRRRSPIMMHSHKLCLAMKKQMGWFPNDEHQCSSEFSFTQLSLLFHT